MNHNESRRRFMRQVTAGTVAVSGGMVLTACGGDGFDPASIRVPAQFRHGVASGDPLADRVILWTRLSPAAEAELEVGWEVARDEAFADRVATGTTTTDAERDYTVKIDVTGLEPATRYFYRFTYDGTHSPVGRTKTLPTGSVEQVRLAVFSCSNYPAGYFNVYADAARMGDLDASVHLGDYIYEYARDGYASAGAAELGRESEPAHEIVALADYRRRHAQYRTDPDLQALHAAMPMIAVWDDHEITNDTWREGAENHQPETEGDFGARREAALRAYHEWMPTRLPEPGRPERIYRSFDFGDLVSLHMLDTRVIGRDEQLDITSYVTQAGFDAARFAADVGDPNRQLLGAEQTTWLQQQMANSSATWQMLGQQVLMARMAVPAPLGLQQIGVGDYAALLAKAAADPASLTAQERAILAAPSIPYNLDAWDGYAAARETVLGMASSLDKNLVVLAGDTHNAWASDLADASGRTVGVEFATASVTSPGFEQVFPNEDPATFAAALVQLVGPLRYADTSRRGFMVVTATPAEVRADWRFVSTIRSREFSVDEAHSLRTLPGAGNRTLVPVVATASAAAPLAVAAEPVPA